MKFHYLVTVTVPDGGGDDGPEDFKLIASVLDEAAEEMDRPFDSTIQTRPLPPMTCTLCGGDGLSIHDPCFTCMWGIPEMAQRLKSARGPLNRLVAFWGGWPQYVVVTVFGGFFLWAALWLALHALGLTVNCT
jgi:hypothetical protein